MATIERRQGRHGTVHYRVKIRLRGLPAASATLPTLAQARRWAAVREGALRERRAFPTPAAARATLAELLDRYAREVLPRKSPSSDIRIKLRAYPNRLMKWLCCRLPVPYWDRL